MIFERCASNKSFATIRAKGDLALFGGKSTQEMKKKLNVSKGALADYLPTITIQAKDFATGITNFNVVGNDLSGEHQITKEHV